jgi:hypothetical protein
MTQRIRSFGGETTSRFSITNGEEISMTLRRVVWFDQDIDGRWLVWATSEDAVSGADAPRELGRPGAIVVRDPRIGTFIEMFGELLAHPERFEDEVVLDDPHASRPNGDV